MNQTEMKKKDFTDSVKGVLMKQYFQNEYYLALLLSGVLLLLLMVTSYTVCWRHAFSHAGDISREMREYAASFYANPCHIWYESFHYYALLLFVLAPIPLARVYADRYYDKSDVNYVYRKGLLRYYAGQFWKALGVSAILAGAALTVYLLGIFVFAHGKGVNIEESGFVPRYYVVPSITLVNESMKRLAAASPTKYMLRTFGTFLVSGISYCVYAYSLGTLLRSRVMRVLMPMIALIIADFIVGMAAGTADNSIAFDTFNPACTLAGKDIVFFNVSLWAVSLALLAAHYFRRRRNG